MRKILFGLLAALFVVLAATGPAAHAAPARPATTTWTDVGETLSVNTRGYIGEVNINYDWTLGYPDGHWVIHFKSGRWDTTPNFNADQMWIDIEDSPNHWTAVAHYGGDGTPQNTVSTGYTIPDHGNFTISNTSDSPAWRLRVKGFEGSTTDVKYDYGNVAF